jgi:hypothetical protein
VKFRTRLGIVLLTLGTCALASFVQLRESSLLNEPVPAELFDVVQSGILALRSHQYESAYLKASSRYQERLDFEHFVEMARADCVAIRQALHWEFGQPARDSGDQALLVPVHFFLPSGQVLPTTFTLVREERAWKIEHVQFAKAPESPRSLGGLRL